MRDNVRGAALRFAIFAVVCSLAGFAMIAVFAQLRFGSKPVYKAEFTSVNGLKQGNFVRVAGVEVGKVDKIWIKDNTTAVVEFAADSGVVLTEGSRVLVRYENLTGERYIALEQGAGGVRVVHPGDTIPINHTAPSLDIDALIGGFQPLFRALDPEQVNTLTGELIGAFQGEGSTIDTLLRETAQFTNKLADRDELIGQLITNLNTVLGSLSQQSKQIDKTVTSLSQLVQGLSARKSDLSTSIAYVNAAASRIADLLSAARPPLKKVVHETDRSSALVVADKDYLDNFLTKLPGVYQVLARQGLYGDFVQAYTCELMLKVNGKNGQPVYVRLANQTSGRCAPK